MSKNKTIALVTAFLLLLGLAKGEAQSSKEVKANVTSNENIRLEIVNTKSSNLSEVRKIASSATRSNGIQEDISDDLRIGIFKLFEPGQHVVKKSIELTWEQMRTLDYFMQIEVPEGYAYVSDQAWDMSDYISLSGHQVDYVDIVTYINIEPVIAELVYDNEKKNSTSYRIPGRLLTDEELKEYGLEQYIKTK